MYEFPFVVVGPSNQVYYFSSAEAVARWLAGKDMASHKIYLSAGLLSTDMIKLRDELVEALANFNRTK